MAGPRKVYRRLTALDVSEQFDFFVHGEYKLRFCRLVPEAARGKATDAAKFPRPITQDSVR